MNVGSQERRIKHLEKSLFNTTLEDELTIYLDMLEEALEEEIKNASQNKQSRNA